MPDTDSHAQTPAIALRKGWTQLQNLIVINRHYKVLDPARSLFLSARCAGTLGTRSGNFVSARLGDTLLFGLGLLRRGRLVGLRCVRGNTLVLKALVQASTAGTSLIAPGLHNKSRVTRWHHGGVDGSEGLFPPFFFRHQHAGACATANAVGAIVPHFGAIAPKSGRPSNLDFGAVRALALRPSIGNTPFLQHCCLPDDNSQQPSML